MNALWLPDTILAQNFKRLPSSPNRPEGTLIHYPPAKCGHQVRVIWDARFPPDDLEVRATEAMWLNHPCEGCRAES